MTITVKCQHSGIEFEATSKRTKQHPLVADFKNEAASKRGNYRLACEALDKAAKVGGYETVDQYMELVNDIYTGAYDTKKEVERKNRNWAAGAEKEQREARTRREVQNRHLRNHGYRWNKEYADFDEYEEGEPSLWVLSSPDGRRVSVAQALDEIERGADVVLAEIEATEQAEAKAKQAAEQAEADYRQAWEDAKNEIKTAMVEVERFDYAGWQTTFDRSRYETITTTDTIFTGQINGIDCAVIYSYLGGHDFYQTEQFYCTDPAAAELTILERDELATSFHRFFGE